MSSTDEDSNFELTGSTINEEPGLDPRSAARIARLLRWYPRDWRERYGDEFEAVLSSSLSDGKGGLRLSLDVAREGIVARMESAGFIGATAPALERARASVITIFVAVFGFLAGTAVVAYYVKGWQRTPVLESLNRAVTVLSHSKAEHTFYRTMTSAAHRRLQLAATRSGNGSSTAWKAFDRFQTKAATHLNNSASGRAFHEAVSRLRPASGAPVVFSDIAHIVTGVAIVCLAIALILVATSAVRIQWRVEPRRLLAPLGFLSASAVSIVLTAIAYQAFQGIPPGQPSSEWWTVKSLFDGNFRFWAVVVFPLCAVASIVFAVIGSVQLLRRVEFAPRLYRIQGSFGIAAAGCLGVVLVSIVTWLATLSVQAPDFLTAKDGGVLGTSFLPIFLAAMVVMIGTFWLVSAASLKCLRSVRTV